MNYFPDQLNTTLLGFQDPGNVYEAEADAENQTLTIRCVVGPALGYEAVLYYNGRLLIGFQEHWEAYNEKLDFVWADGSATATSSTGQIHELKSDSHSNVVIWSIRGRNEQGYEVVLRYLRHFYDDQNALIKSIRYEEGEVDCHCIYQYFEYGLDVQTWKARKAWTYDYDYELGCEQYWKTEIPVDIMEFPENFQSLAVEMRQVR